MVSALLPIALTLPLLSCSASSVAGPAERALIQAFQRVHQPIYRVYDLGSEARERGALESPDLDRQAIHDHLARSFYGEALTREYIEHFSALSQMARESTSIRVLRVDYESVKVLSFDPVNGLAQVDADWSVGGIVRHQQHRHPRTNRYRAIYQMAHGHHGWRLVDTHLRDMSRVRGFDSLAEGNAWPLDDLPKSGSGMMSPLDLLRAGMDEDLKKAGQNAEGSGSGESNPDSDSAKGRPGEPP